MKVFFNFHIANISIGSGVSQGGTELTKGREDTFSGKVFINLFFVLLIYFSIF
jgi:hypothetical protein